MAQACYLGWLVISFGCLINPNKNSQWENNHDTKTSFNQTSN
jgi:hypothetical protein